MANTASAIKNNKGVNVNKLTKEQQEYMKKIIEKNSWMADRISSGHLVLDVTFPYKEGKITKKVYIPERWGMAVEFETITEDDYIIPNPNEKKEETVEAAVEEVVEEEEKSSKDKKNEDFSEMGKKKEKSFIDEIATGFKRSIGTLIFSIVLILIIMALTGGSFLKRQKYVAGRINSMNMGYIDMDCDGIPDTNPDMNDYGNRIHSTIVEGQKTFWENW